MSMLRYVGVLAGCSLAFTAPASAQVVISQVYGGGGNTGALYTHDFIELFNSGAAPANLGGWSVQYASTSGSSWQTTPIGSITLQPGQYLLVQQAQGSGGSTPLPAPDVTGTIPMSGSGGKVALVNSATALSGACPTGAQIQDFVGWGSANCFEGTAAAPATTNPASVIRADAGCTDSNDNGADFSLSNPPTPRNGASAFNVCGGGGDPVLSIADASVAEGNAGTTALEFIVTLSQPAPTGGVAFTASTADGSAQAPADYAALAAAPFAIAEGATSTVVTVQVAGDTQAEPDEDFTVTIATAAPGIALGDATAAGTITNDDIALVEIFEIQGSGPRSPFAPATGNELGQTVTSEDNVVTAVAGSGFFMQTPDARDDGDALTSNGLFVFTGAAPAVAVGDRVDVTGRVQEFFNWTQIAGTPSVTVTANGQPLPTAVAWDESVPSMDPDALSCDDTNFECFENMRVSIAAGALITGNQTFGSDPYAEAFATASGLRARREAGLIPGVPDIAGVPRWDGNPEVFELDADALGTVPNPTALAGGTLFAAEGVIAYEFGQHEFWPTTWTPVPAPLPRPVPVASGEAELRVASFNVLNLCAAGCGDPAPTPAEFALKVQRLSDYVGNTLRLPDVLGVQEIEDQTSLDALATRLNTDFPGASYVTHVGVSNDPRGIRNGFLVREDRVDVVRIRDLDEGVTITQCSGTPPCPLHDRPPLLLEATFAGGDGERFAVMNNHNRSLSGIHDAGANGQRVRFKRFEQGKSIAHLVQRFQLGQELEPATPAGGIDTALVPLVLVGDYNAFEVTDGYVDLVGLAAGTYVDDDNEFKLMGPNIVDPPLADLVLDLELDDRYSYTFRESWGNIQGQEPRTVSSIQVLDHGLINVNATRWCGGLVYGRGNADAPKREETAGTTGVGVSDHDGFVIRLFTDRLFAHGFEQAGRCMR